ncbi:MAG: hypothetical protein ABIR84_07720 [Candidatus Nitrotoga sp.]
MPATAPLKLVHAYLPAIYLKVSCSPIPRERQVGAELAKPNISWG